MPQKWWLWQRWWLRTRIQEVIPMKSKAYRATVVNRVDGGRISQEHPGQALLIGLDIGKYRVLAVARWPAGQFERPWLVANPEQLPALLSLLRQLGQRPRVFELDHIRAVLREQGVPQGSIEPTISFMRLVIPLVIRQVGADGIVRAFGDAAAELRLIEQPGWDNNMAPYIVTWASACLEKYKAGRADAPDPHDQGG
jgi:hypothetical protein